MIGHSKSCDGNLMDSRVLETRFYDGTARRRRECDICEERFTTVEIIADEYETAKSTVNRFEPLAQTIDQFLQRTGQK